MTNNDVSKTTFFLHTFKALSMFILGFVVAWVLVGLAMLVFGNNGDMKFYFLISLAYGFSFSLYYIVGKVNEIINSSAIDTMTK
jgi:hypothetical protein